MANPALAIISQTDAENRMSAVVVGRIMDDGNTGIASAAPMAQLLSDGQARVMGYVRRAYTPAEIALILASPPELLKSLCLDAVQVYAFERFPTYCRTSPEMMTRLQTDLDRVARSQLRFDGVTGNAQDPVPQNVGGIVESGNANAPAPVPAVFSNGMGDW